MVRQSIQRRLEGLETEELLSTLGWMIQRERRKRHEELPAGLYPIQARADDY